LKQDEDFEVIPPKVTLCLLSKGAQGQGEVAFNLKPNATQDVVWMASSASLSDRPPRVACGDDCKNDPQCKHGTSGDLFGLTGIPTYPEGSKIVSGYFGACMKNATTGKLIGGGAYPVRLRHPVDDPSSVVWEGGDAVCVEQLYQCVSNKCTPATTGLPQATCEAGCGPSLRGGGASAVALE
jgi:hypothetical protein